MSATGGGGLGAALDVRIFLLCYNEAVLLPHTIAWYRARLPGARIVVYDNESTDDSAALAASLGCEVRTYRTGGRMDLTTLRTLRNSCWFEVEAGWVIMADMDEWVDVTEADLRSEEVTGSTVLRVRGFEIVPDSKSPTLSDVADTLARCNVGFH